MACMYKIIHDQPPTDDAFLPLLAKIWEVYALMTEEQELADIPSMVKVYGQMARQTLECTDFIVHYSETKKLWKRVGKYVSEETSTTIQNYNKVLDNLIQQFRNRTTHDIILYRMALDLDPSDMVCATGTGLDIFKCCLQGTREGILSKIKSWVCSTGEDVPRVLWLSGAADTGKSAISHTIIKWYEELGGLGACFCFDRTRGADCPYEKIFSTIACNLAACDPFVRRALGGAFHDDNTLKHTTDIIKQWQELIIAPVEKAPKAIVSPLLIVIDGLNESGESNYREQFLHLLAGESSSQPIPGNYRILITSRPLRGIYDAHHTVPHVRHISMDDIPPLSTERDIQLYLSSKLTGPHNMFDDGHFGRLVQKSGGMFEWARLACEYINGATRVGLDPMVRFERVLDKSSGEGICPFDDIYGLILAEIMPEDKRGELIPMFCSVMGQILASSEPLPMTALTAMRLHFPSVRDRYDVARVIGPLDSLLIGTGDSQTPICPVHTSFYDFLKERSRSHNFFVDVSLVQSDLAFASLRVMEYGLCFNICSLESSYLPNSAVTDLETRVKKYISAELSYSCRFWGAHVRATPFELSLAQYIQDFFDGERFLFWLETLALIRSLSSSECLSSIADWFKGQDKYTSVAMDTQKFIRSFGTTILHSTPHLYLSALPFAPPESTVYKLFDTHFPRTARVVPGHVIAQPRILRGDANVMSVAISPDGRRIVCGSDDGGIQVWDRMTGKKLDSPPKGHTAAVRSVAISPDGKLIVSGSNDKTVQVWDAENKDAFTLKGHIGAVLSVVISPDGECVVSGSNDKTIWVWDLKARKALGAPLEGHTDWVQSVVISLDGKRIVSGSNDMTIRIWDLNTRKALGAPLEGHTDWVQSVALSSDGKLIVSGSRDKMIRVWNAETRESCSTPLRGHTDDVMSVAISPDGKHIVSGSADNTVRVWDVENSGVFRTSLQIAEHDDYVRSVAISPDGQCITSGSDDQTIRVWDKAFEAPTSFSSDLASILYSTSALQNSCNVASLKEGWIIDPEGQLLLWIPSDRHPSVANNKLLISNGSSKLDLKYFTHGTSWQKCRERKVVP